MAPPALNHEKLLWTSSTNAGATWTVPAALELPAGDRPVYTAPALSPDGSDLYVVDNAFTTPYRNDTTSPRGLVGQVWHANVVGGMPSRVDVARPERRRRPARDEPERADRRVPR